MDLSLKILEKINSRKKTASSLEFAGLKTSSLIKKIQKTTGGYLLYIDPARRFANTSILKVVAGNLQKQNPTQKLVLDEELLNMKPDEDLLFVSKAPLWCLKQKGNIIVLTRTYA